MAETEHSEIAESGQKAADAAESNKNDEEVRNAAIVLSRTASHLFEDLCERCLAVVEQRLSQLSVSGKFKAAEETSTDLVSTVCSESQTTTDGRSSSYTAPHVDKPKLWSEERSSSSEAEEDSVQVRDDRAYDYDSPKAASREREVREETNHNAVGVSSRAFQNDRFQFAWANVALPSPGTTVDRSVVRTPNNRVLYSGSPGLLPTPFKSDDRNSGIQQPGRPGLLPTPSRDNESASGLEDDITPGHIKGVPFLSKEQRESLRFMAVERKKDFECIERIRGKRVNVTEGLELHKGVFSAKEQARLLELIYELQEKGRKKRLRERTYSEPRKWMRGKGRVTIQFGCCYNYAVDKNGNPPGIIQDNELVDPLPPLLRATIRRMVRWHVLPESCVPDSCIINIYDEGDCIPPHIDHHDFVRPFCTLSLLSECNIIFGSELKIVGPGEFDGRISIPLPVGSVLVLKGNGADVAKHAVPAVPTKRVSITFRKMDPQKVPQGYRHSADLKNIEALPLET